MAQIVQIVQRGGGRGDRTKRFPGGLWGSAHAFCVESVLESFECLKLQISWLWASVVGAS